MTVDKACEAYCARQDIKSQIMAGLLTALILLALRKVIQPSPQVIAEKRDSYAV